MKSFKQYLDELSQQILSRYIRASDDETDEPKRTQYSKNWKKVNNRVQGSTLAKLKIRKKAVKVPAGRATKAKMRAKDWVAMQKKNND